jgi:hypothetical protein
MYVACPYFVDVGSRTEQTVDVASNEARCEAGRRIPAPRGQAVDRVSERRAPRQRGEQGVPYVVGDEMATYSRLRSRSKESMKREKKKKKRDKRQCERAATGTELHGYGARRGSNPEAEEREAKCHGPKSPKGGIWQSPN